MTKRPSPPRAQAVFSNLQPEDDGGDVEHGEVVDSGLRSAVRLERGDAPALFEAADRALDLVALGVGRPVDHGAWVLVHGLRDDTAAAAPTQEVADLPAIRSVRQGLIVGRLAAGRVEDEWSSMAGAAQA